LVSAHGQGKDAGEGAGVEGESCCHEVRVEVRVVVAKLLPWAAEGSMSHP